MGFVFHPFMFLMLLLLLAFVVGIFFVAGWAFRKGWGRADGRNGGAPLPGPREPRT